MGNAGTPLGRDCERTSRGQVQGRAKAGEVEAMRVSPRKLRESWVWGSSIYHRIVDEKGLNPSEHRRS